MEESRTGKNGPRATDLSGHLLGDYRLLRRLGEGAMADVYLAEQCSLKRSVALKILKPRLAADETYVRRFQREAQAAASLVHANIVQIHEVGRIESLHFIAQEYVQGVNLHQWIARQGPPDLQQALLIMRQTAAALAKAAQHGIVHRDIKPENIMLARSGEVKVADFGLARVFREGEGLALTEIGITMGTPLYMSPEQIEGKTLDPRSDIYSAGVTFYQMLAGCPPFSGETALGLALQHVNKQPEPLERHRPDLPSALCRMIHKMLAKKPDGRYASAREVLRELRRIQLDHMPGEGDIDQAFPDLADVPETPLPWNDAAQRLDGLMKTASQNVLPRPRWIGWSLGMAAAFVVGGLLALPWGNEKPLLGEPGQIAPRVPKQDNGQQQWFYATGRGTLRSWQSIVEYFPKEAYYVLRAKQQMARIYLVRDADYESALHIFDELASLDDTEIELKAYGLAGKVAVFGLQDLQQESKTATSATQDRQREMVDTLGSLFPIREKLTDRRMLELLQDTIVAATHLPEPTRNQWLVWLKTRLTSPF